MSLARLARMALGERSSGEKPTPEWPGDAWQPRPYPSLFALAAHAEQLAGRGGIFVVWHLGVRPQWLKAGVSADLGQTLTAAAVAAEFAAFRTNGGVFAAWACPRPERWAGIASGLRARLQPRLQAVALTVEVAVSDTVDSLDFPLPPGSGGEAA